MKSKKTNKIKNIIDKAIDMELEKSKQSSGIFNIVPVPPREFFEVWVKQPLFPEQYRIIDQVFTNDYKDWNTKIHEIILLWGEGGSKDYTVVRTLVYCCYWLGCLQNPQQYFNIGPGTPIVVACMCLAGDSKIYDCDAHSYTTLSSAYTKGLKHTLSVDETTGSVYVNKVKNVFKTGKKQTYVLKVNYGKRNKQIKTSKDHHFFTAQGWKKAEELHAGDKIYIKIKKPWNRGLTQTWLFTHTNSNFETLREVEIISITPYGTVSTYDIEMQGPNHNYIANDFVVHNSVNEDHAKEVFFKQFTQVLKRVINPSTGENFFKEIGVDLRDGKDIQTRKVLFPNQVQAIAADASRYGIEGKNVLMAIFDEIAEVKYDRAKERYENAKNTVFSRFPEHQKVVLISYPRSEFDFMMTKYNEVDGLSEKNKSQIFRSTKAPWEVLSKEGAHPLLIKNRHYRLESDYLPMFNKDAEDATRRYNCKFLKTSRKGFIKKFELVLDKCIKFDRPTPILVEELDRPNALFLTEKELTDVVWQPWFKPNYSHEAYVIEQNLMRDPTNELLKKELLEELDRHVGASYYVHIDLAQGKVESSKKDFAGIVICHPYMQSSTITGYYVDLAIQIQPEDSEINFEDIRKFIYHLEALGFDVSNVSLDGFQSVDFRQTLERRGINVELVSVDRSMKPYDTLKSLLYQGRINIYNYLVLVRELKELRIEGKKVDHPNKSQQRLKEEGFQWGSKDIADALAGSIYSAVVQASETGSTCIDSDNMDADDILDNL